MLSNSGFTKMKVDSKANSVLKADLQAVLRKYSRDGQPISPKVVKSWLRQLLESETRLELKPNSKYFDLLFFHDQVCKNSNEWSDVLLSFMVNLTAISLQHLEIKNHALVCISNHCKAVTSFTLEDCDCEEDCDWYSFGVALSNLSTLSWCRVNSEKTALVCLISVCANLVALNITGVVVESFWAGIIPTTVKDLTLSDITVKLPPHKVPQSILQFLFSDVTKLEHLCVKSSLELAIFRAKTFKKLRILKSLDISLAGTGQQKFLIFNALSRVPQLESFSISVPGNALDVLLRDKPFISSVTLTTLKVTELEACSLHLLVRSCPNLSHLEVWNLHESWLLVPLIATVLSSVATVVFGELELEVTKLALSVHDLLFSSAVFVCKRQSAAAKEGFGDCKVFSVVLTKPVLKDDELFKRFVGRSSAVYLKDCDIHLEKILDLEIVVGSITTNLDSFIHSIQAD